MKMKAKIFKILSAGAIISTIALASCEGTRRDTDTDTEKTGEDVNYPSRDNSGSNIDKTDEMNNQNNTGNERTMDQNNTDHPHMNNPEEMKKNGGPSNGGSAGTTGRTGKGNDTMPNK